MKGFYSDTKIIFKRFLIFVIFIIFVLINLKADSTGENRFTYSATQTPNYKNAYPTPNWDRLKRGIDYSPEKVMVLLKRGVPQPVEDKLEMKLSTYGKVTKSWMNGLKLTIYQIKITNGKSERQVIEELRDDPAVIGAQLDFINIQAIKGP
jgi:hypothetical protein